MGRKNRSSFPDGTWFRRRRFPALKGWAILGFRSQNVFSELKNEAFGSAEVCAVRRQLFNRSRRHATIKLVRLGESFVQKRFCAEHAEIGERAAAQQHAVGSDEAVIADTNGRGRLPALFDVDGVSQDLRLKSGERSKLPDHDRICAINQMSMGNVGVFADDELWLSIFLVREMT